ncbi:MAG: A24 family peptidase [Xanthomonadales bacterium]|nr:A24 family peptidase [Xanthomonadales bacterium]
MEFLLSSTPLLLSGVFLLGLLFGSFLNVVMIRVPALLEYDWRCQCNELLALESGKTAEVEERPPGVIRGRSKCPKCGHQIKAIENIPLLSYLVLKGRCSACRAPISLRYPVVEFLTGLLFVVTIWHFGPTVQGLTALALTAFLIVLTGIDAEHQLLPDNFTLPLLWLGILVNLFETHASLSDSVVGAIFGYMSLWLVYQLFKLVTGKEGMGYGDFKLLGALGAWLGWQMLPLIILLSSLVGALFGLTLMATGKLQRDKPMPFGPFIAAAGWIALIWGQQIIDAYQSYGGGTFG